VVVISCILLNFNIYLDICFVKHKIQEKQEKAEKSLPHLSSSFIGDFLPPSARNHNRIPAALTLAALKPNPETSLTSSPPTRITPS
jgi:hypothetical protein